MMKLLRSIGLLALAALVLSGCAQTGSVASGGGGARASSAESLDEGINDLSNQISNTLISRATKRIAVVDLTMDDRQTKLGQYMTEKLHNRLFLTRKFDLVERSQMAKALREIKRGRTAYFDASTVKELGKQLGAEAIVTGSMTDLGEVLDINLRMIATDTGLTFAVADSRVFKGPIVQRLLVPVTASLSIRATPAEAQIEIDGVPRAKGPDGIVRADVDPGQHRVSVHYPPCYEDYEKTLPVKGTTPLSVALIPKTSALKVIVEPAAARADVLIDGQMVSRTSGKGTVARQLPCGTHELVVQPLQDKFVAYRQDVNLRGDQTVIARLDLQPRLTVKISPANVPADLLVNGKLVASAIKGRGQSHLPAGTYQVTVRPAGGGYKSVTNMVRLESDNTVEIHLARKPGKPEPKKEPSPQMVKTRPQKAGFDGLISQLFGLRHPDSGFRIRVWTSKPTYRVGERAVLNFQADRDAYVTLFNLGTSGKLTLLYPNPFAQNNFVRAGEVVQFPRTRDPFAYLIEGPRGTERIKAIATTAPLTLSGVQLSTGRFASWEPGNTRDIGILTRDLAVVPRHNWTETTYSFDVK